MNKKFEDKNYPIIIKSTGNIPEKVRFVQNLHDKALDKINHFDRLRQQLLNYAFIVFSALLAFVMKTEDSLLKIIGCVGIAALMIMFCFLDQRYHRSTHGFESSIIIFNQVIAYLLESPQADVEFLQYHTPGEKTTQKYSLQTKIYVTMTISTIVLAFILGLRWIKDI